MNVNTGEIISDEELKIRIEELKKCGFNDRAEELKKKHITMKIPPTPLQKKKGKVGRNELCPCGSGLKFKKCHLQLEG